MTHKVFDLLATCCATRAASSRATCCSSACGATTTADRPNPFRSTCAGSARNRGRPVQSLRFVTVAVGYRFEADPFSLADCRDGAGRRRVAGLAPHPDTLQRATAAYHAALETRAQQQQISALSICERHPARHRRRAARPRGPAEHPGRQRERAESLLGRVLVGKTLLAVLRESVLKADPDAQMCAAWAGAPHRARAPDL